MTPMRVLYLIDCLGSGGAQRQLVTLVNALDRRLVTPEVAVYHPHEHFRPDLEATSTPVHQLGVMGGRDPRVLMRLARLIGRGDFDLVHSYITTPGVLARLASGCGRRAAVVISERNVNLGRSRPRLLVERVLIRCADFMIVNAEAVRRHVERVLPGWRGRIRVVPNGIAWTAPSSDESSAARGFRARCLTNGAEILLGVVARVAPQKAPHLLLEALARLPRDVLGRISVVWIGARKEERFWASVQSRVESLKLGDHIRFLPPVREIRSVYLAIDGLVLPSGWEGFPNVLLEAMAEGRPVIATDVGDAAALVEHGRSGWLVGPGDVDALAGAMQELAQASPDRRSEMGRAGSSFVRERYSVGRLVEGTMAVYEEVMERRRG